MLSDLAVIPVSSMMLLCLHTPKNDIVMIKGPVPQCDMFTLYVLQTCLTDAGNSPRTLSSFCSFRREI